MEQAWFEMPELRGRRLGNGSWIPLRASKVVRDEGEFADVGYLQVYEGTGSVAFPVACEDAAKALGWLDIGPSNSHTPWARDGQYDAVDVCAARRDAVGVHLVLVQSGYGKQPPIWHLHQDFVLALGLYREGDIWVRPAEGYLEVAKLIRNTEGHPVELIGGDPLPRTVKQLNFDRADVLQVERLCELSTVGRRVAYHDHDAGRRWATR